MSGSAAARHRRRAGSSRVATPLQIFGAALFLWLRADLGVTRDGSDRVSVWADQSGKGNDVSQAPGDQPLYVASVLNGKPAIRFASANTEWLGRALLDVEHADPTSLVAVFKLVGTGNRTVVGTPDAAKRQQLFLTLTNNFVAAFAGLSVAGTTSQQNVWTAALAHMGTSGAVYVNDFATAQATGTTGNENMAGVRIGANQTPANFIDGDVPEVIAVDGATTAAQRAKLAAYFRARYALAVVG